MKKALGLILAAIMAFGGISAFAAEIGDTLEWYFDEELYEYSYQGEIAAGTLTIERGSPEGSYYILNSQTAGFYSFTYDYYRNDIYFYSPKKLENGVAYNAVNTNAFFDYDNDEYTEIFYLNAGENIIGADIYYVDGKSTDIDIEFLGETITAVEIEDELILDCDVWNYDDHFEIYDAATVIFSSGKEIPISYLESIGGTVAVEGENTSTCLVSGQKVAVTFTACHIDKYVKDVNITNIEDYLTITESYTGFYDYSYPFGETLTVTFADGSTQSFVLGYDDEKITMPNGREYWIYYYHDTYSREPAFIIGIGDNIIKSYACTIESTPVSESFAQFVKDNIQCMQDSSYYFRRALAIIFTARDLEDMPYHLENSLYYFEISIMNFVELFTNFAAFIQYLF